MYKRHSTLVSSSNNRQGSQTHLMHMSDISPSQQNVKRSSSLLGDSSKSKLPKPGTMGPESHMMIGMNVNVVTGGGTANGGGGDSGSSRKRKLIKMGSSDDNM